MNENKKRSLHVLVIVLCSITIVMALVFFNRTFYTDKEYSIKQTEKVVSIVSNVRDKASELDISLKNREYNVNLYVDKKFAYENNFPYYDSLSANIETGNHDNKEFILNMEAFLGDESIGEFDILSNNDSFYYYIPGMSDKILQCSKENSEENEKKTFSLFSKMISYSKLSPDETFDLFSSFFMDTVKSLPSECFYAECGAFGKSTVMISARDGELGNALGQAIDKQRTNESFKLFTESVFTEEELTNLAEGFKQIENVGNNIYSISIESNFTGKISAISVSCVVDNVFQEWSLTFDKNAIAVSSRDNSNFEDGLKEYTEKSIQINYGRNIDGTYKGFVIYTDSLGQASAEFDNLCFKEGVIFGKISSEMVNGNIICLNLEDEHSNLSLSSEGKEVVSIDIMYSDKDIKTKVPVETGQKTSDTDAFWDEVFNSPKHDAFIEDIQAEELAEWIYAWRYE